jgi:drug/metabolite transporter (DMT)-like permease
VKLLRTYGSIILATLFWAFSFIWFKIANEAYRPLTVVYLRLIISVIILSLFLYFTGRFEKIKRKDWKYFILMSFFEPFLYFIGESIGLTYVSSTTGSVIIATIPVFTAIGAWIMYKERLKLINYAGIAISLTGVFVFVVNRSGSLTFDPRGLALLFLAVISASGYTLILKKLAHNYHPIYIVNVQNIMGTILFFPIIMIFEIEYILDFTYNSRSFIAIIELALFASCGAFILFGFAVRKLGVTRANVFSNLIPIFTAIFAFIILKDHLTVQNIIGMAIVISGLFLSQWKRQSKKSSRSFLA